MKPLFDNPKGLAKAKTVVTCGDKAVLQYGEFIWDRLCEFGCNDDSFRLRDIQEALQEEYKLAPSTARNYIQAFITYMRAVPKDFKNASKLERVRHGLYRTIPANND